MKNYPVLRHWITDEGEYQPGDTVSLPSETPAEQVELTTLINYGIVGQTPQEDREPDSASTTTTTASKRSRRS